VTGIPFDDADLEDAWDASDRLVDLFDNAALRIRELLADDPDPARQARAARLFDDLETIRRRLVAGELD
jgi:hypothetical protein